MDLTHPACGPAGGHGHVVASGRCADCVEPVVATGTLSASDLAPGAGWMAAREPDPATATRCLATGRVHRPLHAVGICADCSTRLEALAGGAAWFGHRAPDPLSSSF